MEYKYCSKCGTKNDIKNKNCEHCNCDFSNEKIGKNIIENIKEENKKIVLQKETYYLIISIIAPILEFMLVFDNKIRMLFPIILCIVIGFVFIRTKYKDNQMLIIISNYINKLLFILGIIICIISFII